MAKIKLTLEEVNKTYVDELCKFGYKQFCIDNGIPISTENYENLQDFKADTAEALNKIIEKNAVCKRIELVSQKCSYERFKKVITQLYTLLRNDSGKYSYYYFMEMAIIKGDYTNFNKQILEKDYLGSWYLSDFPTTELCSKYYSSVEEMIECFLKAVDEFCIKKGIEKLDLVYISSFKEGTFPYLQYVLKCLLYALQTKKYIDKSTRREKHKDDLKEIHIMRILENMEKKKK